MNGEDQALKSLASLSFLDKTDWRRTIHQNLEHCVNTIGNIEFPKAVKGLMSCVSATYPGFDAELLIGTMMKLTTMKYDLMKQIWLINNQTVHWWEKRIKFAEFNIQRDEEMFTYIKNLVAHRRMLLWGIKSVPTGSQMGADEEDA